ncbi:MAG: MobF family relaxase [Acidimicrobiia bacterium]
MTTLYASSAAATASYYTRYLTRAPGEVDGVWTGTQATALGVSGSVSGEALELLLEGRDPVRGTRLGYPLTDRVLADGRLVRAVAGFDATFSAPKSVSVLWALSQDPRLLEAHDAAVTAALAHLERYGSTTRVRADGRRLHPDSQGLMIATFRQTTSRLDDPQLHTHAVVSARVQTVDGRWLALDARYLKRHQRMLGGLYQSVLRSELVDRLGVAWGPIVNGQSEIAGMPAELLETFSKRTSQVDEALAAKLEVFRDREGRDPTRWERAALTREASADTRGHKTGNGVADLHTRWTSEAAALGWTAVGVVDSVTAVGRELNAEPTPRATVAQIVEALSVAGSTWNRADVIRALCDAQRPLPAMPASRWAEVLERACDTVTGTCVELDPPDAAAPRRTSDGRSLWLEPTAPHITSEHVLAEEEYVLSWAIDAQTADPQPSPTVDRGGLDVLQADVAAAVAGYDRLVLAVGPAGTGKTTTLRAAAADLNRQGRQVFGVAPSAKAARVLQRRTGIAADTLAKLLHEWERDDRPPLDRYRLPAGATVIVDEAGMVGTGALARLVTLAEQCDWRLALIGDHRQLQAVGRGGLFHELCVAGRSIELTRIHRFVEPWEAAASLQLRHGDPRGLTAYFDHDRVIADTFDNHLTRIAGLWLDTAARHRTAAITTSTNEHVDAINTAVQMARINAGQLDADRAAPVGGGEHAYVGDIVATRRNDRHLITTAGEPIRNRELWTVTGLHENGALIVTSHLGSGNVILPAEYARQHVRLGYATTEYGNQSDTVTIGVELATTTTTRRGLYVGVSRGEQENWILVVTEDRDLDQARDILEGVLASDRADIPATTQRRTLADTDRTPHRHEPSLQPRCEIPSWLEPLRTRVRDDLDEATADAAADAKLIAELNSNVVAAKQRLAEANHACEPYRPGLEAAENAVRAAREQWWTANNRGQRAPKGRHHRAARRDVERATLVLDEALAEQQRVEEIAKPAISRRNEAAAEVRSVEITIRPTQQLIAMSDHAGRTDFLRDLDDALDTWQRWATGRTVPSEQLDQARALLDELRTTEDPALGALAVVLTAPSTITSVQPPLARSDTPERDIGIGIG